MFWNKKEVAEVAEVEGLPVTLSRREAFIWGQLHKKFLAYREGNEWRGLVGYEEYKEKTDSLEKKLDLILNHLKLEYVPETETKEPAKLVEMKDVWTPDSVDSWGITGGLVGGNTDFPKFKPKKKAGRPKKK